VVPPFNCGIPDHSAVKARCVSFTAFNPLAVILKNRFALPPRSGVGSPPATSGRFRRYRADTSDLRGLNTPRYQ
jgi:hypothetical protein